MYLYFVMIPAMMSVPPVELFIDNTIPRPMPQHTAPMIIAIVSLLTRGSVMNRSQRLSIMVSATELNKVLKTYFRPKKNHASINNSELMTINEIQIGTPVEYRIRSDTPPKPPITISYGMRKPVNPTE